MNNEFETITFEEDELKGTSAVGVFQGLLTAIKLHGEDFEKASFVFTISGEDFEAVIARVENE